jgi:hypothetical protein
LLLDWNQWIALVMPMLGQEICADADAPKICAGADECFEILIQLPRHVLAINANMLALY